VYKGAQVFDRDPQNLNAVRGVTQDYPQFGVVIGFGIVGSFGHFRLHI
jgi:hypothetical protein